MRVFGYVAAAVLALTIATPGIGGPLSPPQLPGPALTLPVDVNGDGLSEYGDLYAFNYWLEQGGSLGLALSTSAAKGELVDLTGFFRSPLAQLAPKAESQSLDSAPEDNAVTPEGAPLGPSLCPLAVRADAPEFTRRIPPGSDPTSNADTLVLESARTR
jgi:hypothetical protein